MTNPYKVDWRLVAIVVAIFLATTTPVLGFKFTNWLWNILGG